jgi:hypothetical protein
MRKFVLTVIAFFCSTATAQAATDAPPQAGADNEINKRIVRIQQQLQAKQDKPAALDDIRISQWVNFPNWPNWDNWNNNWDNWNNWYNY